MIRRAHDISLPLHEGMWRYRKGWENRFETLSRTRDGDTSTVYRFNLCSHSGTYLETSQHKLANDITLDDFQLSAFVRPCKVAVLNATANTPIELAELHAALGRLAGPVEKGDALLLATGWGSNRREPDYVSRCPSFAVGVVEQLCEFGLDLLGTDLPIIDNQVHPFNAVAKLFEVNPNMLLLAPLAIDVDAIRPGSYLLSAAPLKIEAVCASPCRPVLIESDA